MRMFSTNLTGYGVSKVVLLFDSNFSVILLGRLDPRCS